MESPPIRPRKLNSENEGKDNEHLLLIDEIFPEICISELPFEGQGCAGDSPAASSGQANRPLALK